MSYKIAIPTYNRPREVAEKTLQMLQDGGVSPTIITLFVANQQQRRVYEENVPRELYHQIVVGKKGITNQRNFITRYYREGEQVVSLDDDVEELDMLRAGKLAKIRDVDAFFRKAFQELHKKRLFLWGIYPVRNAFYMYPGQTTDLRFIIGVVHGYIVRHDPNLKMSVQAESKEDYERTLQHFLKDGGVLRFNNIAAKTKFNAPGGLGTDRHQRNAMAARYLTTRYPDLVERKDRPNGTPEVKLIKPKKDG